VHLVGKLRPQVTVVVASDTVEEPAEEEVAPEEVLVAETEEVPAEEA
jgi:hypothetical protein